jgi:hypothetical protein
MFFVSENAMIYRIDKVFLPANINEVCKYHNISGSLYVGNMEQETSEYKKLLAKLKLSGSADKNKCKWSCMRFAKENGLAVADCDFSWVDAKLIIIYNKMVQDEWVKERARSLNANAFKDGFAFYYFEGYADLINLSNLKGTIWNFKGDKKFLKECSNDFSTTMVFYDEVYNELWVKCSYMKESRERCVFVIIIGDNKLKMVDYDESVFCDKDVRYI